MAERLDERYRAPRAVRRRYLWEWMLWLLAGLAIGATIALAEHCHWLPKRFLDAFALPPQGHVPFVGALILQTIPIPLLFVTGLHQASFYYTSRLICLFFCCCRGLDVWKCLLAIINNPSPSIVLIVVWVALVLGMMCILLCAVLAATGEPRHEQRRFGMRLSGYLTSLFEFWGAMILAQAAFYLIYHWFL